MKSLVSVLKPLYDVTMDHYGEKQATVSKVAPLTKILKAFYSRNDQSDKTALELKKRLLTKQHGPI